MTFKTKRLKGKRIAVLIADGFEMAEFTVPVNALRAAGASITCVSLRNGRIRGVNLHEPAQRVRAHATVDKVSESEFDALFVPGGFINPDLLRQSEEARSFVRAFARANKPMATLCHGPWVFGSSGLLTGRTLTSWPGIRDDVVNAGGTWLDEPTVCDGNLLTSRGPQDFAAFVPQLVQFFSEPTSMRHTSDLNFEKKSSPQRTEAPKVVLAAMRYMPRPSLRGFVLGLLVGYLASQARVRGPQINKRLLAQPGSLDRQNVFAVH